MLQTQHCPAKLFPRLLAFGPYAASIHCLNSSNQHSCLKFALHEVCTLHTFTDNPQRTTHQLYTVKKKEEIIRLCLCMGHKCMPLSQLICVYPDESHRQTSHNWFLACLGTSLRNEKLGSLQLQCPLS